jgi:hypothetical protein
MLFLDYMAKALLRSMIYAFAALVLLGTPAAAAGVDAVEAWWGRTVRTYALPYAVSVLWRISLSFSLPVDTTGAAVPEAHI